MSYLKPNGLAVPPSQANTHFKKTFFTSSNEVGLEQQGTLLPQCKFNTQNTIVRVQMIPICKSVFHT